MDMTDLADATTVTDGKSVQYQVVHMRKKANDAVLAPEVIKTHIAAKSDLHGFAQLAFHASFALGAMFLVQQARASGSIVALVIAELALGFIASFYFMGFHELIHGTAFATSALNNTFASLFGFIIFRGSRWYWYFHWNHHRYTNDVKLDPELSGSTVDREDPLEMPGWPGLKAYALFLSGYPFGFERLPGIYRYALGCHTEEEIWVNTEKKKTHVQQEYILYALGYSILTITGLWYPTQVGAPLFYYWILPHILGAGHLRYYQTAEHRSCHTAAFTETTAWENARTTRTAWLYSQLAWNMPYHSEHHAWPNVPFHQLPAVCKAIDERKSRPETKCNPPGVHGYVFMHWSILNTVLGSFRQKRT